MNDSNLIKNEVYGYYSVDPLPTPSELSDFYEQEYYQNETGQYNKEYSATEIEYVQIDCHILESIYCQVCPGTNRRSLLDIGCGEGFQSSYFFQRGWEVTCCDYADFGIKSQTPELLPFFRRRGVEDLFTTFGDQQGNFSLIMLKNVLEHVIAPIETLAAIRGLMDKESLLLINVPNDYSPFQNYLQNSGYTTNTWFCPPQHLHYFQFDSLQRLLDDQGFEIVSMQAGFPIEQFLTNASSNYVKNRSVGRNAHLARCELSLFLLAQGINKFISLREANAAIDFGRDVIAIVRQKHL